MAVDICHSERRQISWHIFVTLTGCFPENTDNNVQFFLYYIIKLEYLEIPPDLNKTKLPIKYFILLVMKVSITFVSFAPQYA